eukprot:contig_26371_g6484
MGGPIRAATRRRASSFMSGTAKMDYYPSTGTVKTSMGHPTQGHTQMFRRDLDDASFGGVCENPRTHTGHGYQTKGGKGGY